MNLSESLALLRNKLLDINIILSEDKGHLDHPEDLVFLGGSNGASRAVQGCVDTVKNPGKITIKWDGYPALIFGRDVNNKFSIMDKHMFNKKDGTGRQVYSPDEFRQYDANRGVDRAQLYDIISDIWPGLEKSDSTKGYYWGDLLFTSPLVDKNGIYTFKANPNGLTYTVDADSEIGKLFRNKVAGIVVHQYLQPDAPTTDNASPLDGSIGSLKNNSNVAIMPAKMPMTPSLKLDNKLVANANNKIKQYGSALDKLMDTAPQARNSFNIMFTAFINKKIVSGDLSNLFSDFMEYVQTRPMTASMKAKIDKHLNDNLDGIKGAFEIWAAIYQLKMAIVAQLNAAAENSPVKGYLDNGTQSQEGFVSHGLKFVDRLGFSRQNLAGR